MQDHFHHLITDQPIREDCLLPVIQSLTAQQVAQHFGPFFLQKDGWQKTFLGLLRQEFDKTYQREAFMMGFQVQSRHLFGLPERTDRFLLSTTEEGEPYRLFSVDMFPHKEWKRQGLYSGVPYLMGHTSSADCGILWVNSAETWVDILEHEYDGQMGRLANFLSEAGVMEFFMIAASTPTRLSTLLSHITAPNLLPPLFSLGFHYSKWEPIASVDRTLYYNERFEQAKIPLDVLWLDLPHTE